MFTAFSVYGQTKGEYIKRFEAINDFIKRNGIEDFGKLDVGKSQRVFRVGGGVDATLNQTQIIKDKVRQVENFLRNNSNKTAAFLASNLASYNFIDNTDAMKIAAAFKNGQEVTAVIAGLAARFGNVRLADIMEFFEKQQAIAQRPARPDSPSNQSIRRILKRGHKVQKLKLPKATGDYFGNLSAGVDYNYTEYEDTANNEEGNIHDWSMTLNGTLFENTDLSFSFLANEIEARGELGDTDGQSVGGDFLLLHKLNDNFGLGTYAFYQETDYVDGDDHAIGKGFGFLFTTNHEIFENLQLSTVNTITRAYYEFGHDTLYVGSVNLTKYWTDSFSSTLSAAYTDSLRSETEGDNSYWTFGVTLGYQITDNLNFYMGYDTERAIKDYKSRTWRFGFNYLF